MDVGTVGVAQTALSAYQAGTTRKAAENYVAAQNAGLTEEKDPHGEAFSVNISSAGKEAQANAAQITENQESTDTATIAEGQTAPKVEDASETEEAPKTKGLSNEEVEALMADVQEKSMQFMIDLMSANNTKLQDYLDNNVGQLNFGGVKIDTSRFAMPEVATTPEEAEKALGEGGDWSVEKVSDRIFGLAEALAAGDPDKLEQMRSAVQKGFEQAGADFKEHFGANDTPQITKDTYAEIMNRFDNKAAEWKNAANGQNAPVAENVAGIAVKTDGTM